MKGDFMKAKTLAHLGATVPGALYVLSPIDAIPDIIPVAGQVDDAGVIALTIMANVFIVVVAMLLFREGNGNGRSN
jgi:uncharacterized membrane protein YkvA (DUF1232 family)